MANSDSAAQNVRFNLDAQQLEFALGTEWIAAPAPPAAAAGVTGSIQFNTANALDGVAGLTYDGVYIAAPEGLLLQEGLVNVQAELDFANATGQISMQIFNDVASSETNPNMYFKNGTHSANIFIIPAAGKTVTVSTASLDIADNSAILQANSVTQGFLPPRMTNTERDAIAAPAEGLTIYSTSDHALEFWNGSVWKVVATV